MLISLFFECQTNFPSIHLFEVLVVPRQMESSYSSSGNNYLNLIFCRKIESTGKIDVYKSGKGGGGGGGGLNKRNYATNGKTLSQKQRHLIPPPPHHPHDLPVKTEENPK